MKKLKINLLAIIGLMVAVGTLAFTAPKENLATTHWFEIDGNGVISTESTSPTTLDANDCLVAPSSEDPCAVGFDESDLTQDDEPPVSNMSELENSNLEYDLREKEEPI